MFSRCSGVVRRSGSTLLMRKGSMMVRTELKSNMFPSRARKQACRSSLPSGRGSVTLPEFRVDLALHRAPVDFKTARCFLVASSLFVHDGRVARERLICGEAPGA